MSWAVRRDRSLSGLGRRGTARPGTARARWVMAGQGEAWQARLGEARRGPVAEFTVIAVACWVPRDCRRSLVVVLMLEELAAPAARLINDVLTLSVVYDRTDEAVTITESVCRDELAGAVVLAGLAFAVARPMVAPLRVLTEHAYEEASPELAAARMIAAASRSDSELLHDLATVCTRQPSVWRRQLIAELISAFAAVHRILGMIR